MTSIINNFEITNDFTITDGSVQIKTNDATGSLDISGNITIGSSTSDNTKLIIKNTNNSIIELKANNSNIETTKSITNKSGVLEFTSNASLNKCKYEFNVGDSDSVGFMNSVGNNKPGIVFGRSGTGSLSVNDYTNAHIFYSTSDSVNNALNFTGEKFIFNTSTGNFLTLQQAMIIDANGNVGMGTNPTVSLDVGGTDAIRIPVGTTAQKQGLAQNGYIRYNTDDNQFEGYGNSNWGSLGGVMSVNKFNKITADNADGLRFYTAASGANVERMKILNDGNVGIGIQPTSSYKLNVGGTVRATNFYTNEWLYHNSDTNTKIGFPSDYVFTIETSGEERMRVDEVGNVGIGQFPNASYKLDVNGSIRFANTLKNLSSNMYIDSISNIYFQSGGNTKMTMTSTGLGIGVSPSAELHVDGNVIVTQDITAFYTSSDKRLKTNIKTIENPLQIIKNIRGVRFNWNEKAMEINNSIDLDKIEMGVIAQEIEEYIPEIIKKGLSDYMAVRYEKIAPLLIEGIKSQQTQIETMTTQMDIMKTQIEKQQEQIDELKELIKKC